MRDSAQPIERIERPLAGIGYSLTGMTVFAFQDVIVKLLSGEYSVFQIVFFRSLIALVPLSVAILATAGVRGFVTRRPGVLMLRGMLMFLSYLCYYLAIAALPLADVVSIAFAAPLFVTALSVPILKEHVGARRWIAVFLGFGGVLVMVGPTGDVVRLAALLALMAALTYALSTIVTRHVGTGESGLVMSVYAQVVFALGSAIGSIVIVALSLTETGEASYDFLVRSWILTPLADLGLIALTGVIAAIGHFCLAQAYRIAPVSVVAPFDYTYFFWAVLFGYVIWGDTPSGTTLIGMTIVMLSGLYILSREVKLGKSQTDQGGSGVVKQEL